MINILKNQKGITMIILLVTVILLVIITATIAFNVNKSLELSNLTKLENDIQALNDRVAVYYVANGTLPVTNTTYTKTEISNSITNLSANDGNIYYEIDISALSNITLNYGSNTDTYIINEESHNIYYLEGISYGGTIYHTLGNNNEITLAEITNEVPQEIAQSSDIYALLFNDGTLVFNTTGEVSIRHEASDLVKTYTNLQSFGNENSNPWYSDGNYTSITTVDFEEEVHPASTAFWFYNCTNLESIKHINKLDTRNVTTMAYMFNGCGSIKTLDLGGFITNNVTNMAKMFNECSSLETLNLIGFSTTEVSNMQYMFNSCNALTELDLSSFNTGATLSMQYMFNGCSNLTTITVGENWNTDTATNSNKMFKNCTSLVGQNGTTYSASYTDKTYAHADGGVLNPGYLTVKRILTDKTTVASITDTKIEGKDKYGNWITIPAGFKIAADSGNDVTQGIIIEDNDIQIDGNGNQRGNQYVWIPTGKIYTDEARTEANAKTITAGRYEFANGTSNYTNESGTTTTTAPARGTPILKQSLLNYATQPTNITYGNYHIISSATNINIVINERYYEDTTVRDGVANSDTTGLNKTARDLSSFASSVVEKHGYYIARYEASWGTGNKVKSRVSTGTPPTGDSAPSSRTNGQLWNWITEIDAAGYCRTLQNEYTGINSDLMNSYAWDTAIVYIQTFSGDNDYSYQTSINGSSDGLKNTGNLGATNDEVCKINDMASNCQECTTEYCATQDGSHAYPCVIRGGYYSSSLHNTAYRNGNEATFSYESITFRPILYL